MGSELGKDGLNPALTSSANVALGIPSKGVSPDRISEHVIAKLYTSDLKG